MSQLTMFLSSVAGGCLLALFALLFVRDIIVITRYNRAAMTQGKSPRIFELLWNYAFGGLVLVASIALFIYAAGIGFSLVRELIR